MLVSLWNEKSSIARSFVDLCSTDRDILFVDKPDLDADLHLICSGVLHGKNIADMTDDETSDTWEKNFTWIASYCDILFEKNKRAKVCIIGSHSARKGSFDMAYAGAKAAMHLYIETKLLKYPNQSINGIAPHIIWDSGMTQRRDDLDELADRAMKLRRKRWIFSREVARLAHFLLLEDTGSICNAVIPVTGGNN